MDGWKHTHKTLSFTEQNYGKKSKQILKITKNTW